MNKGILIPNHLNIDIQQEKYGIYHFKNAHEVKSRIFSEQIKKHIIAIKFCVNFSFLTYKLNGIELAKQYIKININAV